MTLSRFFNGNLPPLPEVLALSKIPDDCLAPEGASWLTASPYPHCICRECGAVFNDGEWKWGSPSAVAIDIKCPACQRIDQDQPAGYLVLHGDFSPSQGQELRSLLLRRAMREGVRHPMERIINISGETDTMVVKTTGARLARGLGVTLATTYRGSLRMCYDDRQHQLRVEWHKWKDCCRILRKSATVNHHALC